MEGRFMTDTGKVRNHNEDSGGVFQNDSNLLLALIADGMGGHRAGDVASQMTAEKLREKWQHTQINSPAEAETWFEKNLEEVNADIFAHSLANEECRGMGTTIVSAVCAQEFVTIAHVGDSRCYLFTDGLLKQVTEDHSLVNELVRSGEITKEDAQNHPRKNVVLKAVGTEKTVKPDFISISWSNNDKLLLCSDGLTDMLSDHEIETYFQEVPSIDALGNKLIDTANERGGEDNISLVVMHHHLQEKAGDDAC